MIQNLSGAISAAINHNVQSGRVAEPVCETPMLDRITKAVAEGDDALADVFIQVEALAERLLGAVLPTAMNAEPVYPPAPGALNEILWRAETHAAHVQMLREKLHALKRAL